MENKLSKVTSQVLVGLKGSERDMMVTQLMSSEVLLKRLEELIEKEINSLDSITYEDFDSPSWAYKQAYKLGLKEGLNRLKKLIHVSR